MIPEEAKEFKGKWIKIAAPGMIKGWKYAKILEVNPHANTPNGKGTVKVHQLPDRNAIFALPQIELFREEEEEA